MKGTGLYMKELAVKSVKELVAMRKEAKRELFELRMKNSVRALKETHKIGDLRVKIARINTVLNSKVNQ